MFSCSRQSWYLHCLMHCCIINYIHNNSTFFFLMLKSSRKCMSRVTIAWILYKLTNMRLTMYCRQPTLSVQTSNNFGLIACSFLQSSVTDNCKMCIMVRMYDTSMAQLQVQSLVKIRCRQVYTGMIFSGVYMRLNYVGYTKKKV